MAHGQCWSFSAWIPLLFLLLLTGCFKLNKVTCAVSFKISKILLVVLYTYLCLYICLYKIVEVFFVSVCLTNEPVHRNEHEVASIIAYGMLMVLRPVWYQSVPKVVRNFDFKIT